MGDLKKLFAHRDVTNTVSGKQMNDIIVHTCDNIIDVLSSHCGLYAKHAMLIIDQGMDSFNPSIFTKDGIDILNAIEYISPIQNYIKSIVGYVGTRVDSVAHDGTTTSMLLTAMLIRNIYANPIKSPDEFVIEMNSLLEYLEECKYTVESASEVLGLSKQKTVGQIAYIQTLITSKNDKLLADCMRTIFEATPDELFTYFSYRREPMETADTYGVYYPEEDAWLDIVVSSNLRYNHALGTEYLQEDMDLIVVEEPLITGYTEVDRLIKYLSTTTRPTLVVYHTIEQDVTKKLFDCNPDNQPILAMFGKSQYGARAPIELKVLNAVAGVMPLHEAIEDDDFVIKNVQCHIDRGSLRISNLYKCNEHGVHEWYNDEPLDEQYTGPDGIYVTRYNRLISEVRDLIHRLENKHNADVRKELLMYTESLRTMIGGRLPILKLGGQTLDIRANESVVQDALGAITSSLTDGFVVDGNLKVLFKATDKSIYSEMEDLFKIIHNISTRELDGILDETYFGKGIDIECRKGSYVNTSDGTKVQQWGTAEDNDHVVIQPIKLYKELIKRLIELIPKFMITSRIIIPGGANVE